MDKRTAASKRTKPPRDSEKSKTFIKDWERLSRSGKHDMNFLKEAMLLLIANDAPLPLEWHDHKLKGNFENFRECHIKGDLLLLYRLDEDSDGDLVTFVRAGTHSEIFS
ncbi:MAG: type II toxin-antitoxin system YafQ family toxin [Synergistaceae bacterium]|nr:type II toxin-antitoxin system YafQ family toxin [Synergistaceae bacterium]